MLPNKKKGFNIVPVLKSSFCVYLFGLEALAFLRKQGFFFFDRLEDGLLWRKSGLAPKAKPDLRFYVFIGRLDFRFFTENHSVSDDSTTQTTLRGAVRRPPPRSVKFGSAS